MPPKKQGMSAAAINRLVAQQVTTQFAAAMAEYETFRNSGSGGEASGTATRVEPVNQNGERTHGGAYALMGEKACQDPDDVMDEDTV
ncbi:hypothetical protein CTI12_AA608410 [Artemisia annua]|uniref:Uncharacterized protein n=1 Tax=Artemisia annua TaxID=35608 RepID=A0A2U1KFL7_ARTAN|nr:hypothetical protein CTI12_AA608410 [Artemisia annua]